MFYTLYGPCINKYIFLLSAKKSVTDKEMKQSVKNHQADKTSVIFFPVNEGSPRPQIEPFVIYFIPICFAVASILKVIPDRISYLHKELSVTLPELKS